MSSQYRWNICLISYSSQFSVCLSEKVGVYLQGCFVLPLTGGFLQVRSDSLKCLFLFVPDGSVIKSFMLFLRGWVSVRIKAQGLFVVLFCRSLWLDGSWRTEPWLSFPHPSEVSWCFHWLTDACVCLWWRLGRCVCLREREAERMNSSESVNV